jgi:predicted transposase/invertase (TIGR01784 family)
MVNEIHQPMDKLFKRVFTDVRVMGELLQAHFSQEIVANMDLSTLKIEKNTFVTKEYRNIETDLLYSVRCKEATAFVYVLCEMQSTVDDGMVLRLMGYLHSFFDQYRKQSPKQPLPVVYPIVIYAGEKIWDSPLNFFDLFGENKQRVRSILTSKVSFIDIHRLPDDRIESHRWVGLFEFVLDDN